MSNTIYSLLEEKTINCHYLKRYIKFINKFNGSGKIQHHILPKANDMFPQYKDLNIYPWNISYLGAREHFVAHWILWKALGGSQTNAFFSMKNKNKESLNSKAYEKLLKDFVKNHPMKDLTIKYDVTKRARETNIKKGTYLDTSKRFKECDENGISWASKIGKRGNPSRLLKDSDTFKKGAQKAKQTNVMNGTYKKRSHQLKELWKNDDYKQSAVSTMKSVRQSEEFKQRNTYMCDICGKSIISKGNLKQHKRKCGYTKKTL